MRQLKNVLKLFPCFFRQVLSPWRVKRCVFCLVHYKWSRLYPCWNIRLHKNKGNGETMNSEKYMFSRRHISFNSCSFAMLFSSIFTIKATTLKLSGRCWTHSIYLHFTICLYSHWTTSWFEILRGCCRAGCHTRQSSFFPFMLRRGCSEKKLDTEPAVLERFWIWPGRSVSHETRGVGRPIARQEAARRNDWPSIKTSGSREEMGRTTWRGEVRRELRAWCARKDQIHSSVHAFYLLLLRLGLHSAVWHLTVPVCLATHCVQHRQ